MKPTDPFLFVVDAYSAATRLSDRTVSRKVFVDNGKIIAMRNGAGITWARREAALQWFSDNWPVGAEWPAAVARPAASPSAKSEDGASAPARSRVA